MTQDPTKRKLSAVFSAGDVKGDGGSETTYLNSDNLLMCPKSVDYDK